MAVRGKGFPSLGIAAASVSTKRLETAAFDSTQFAVQLSVPAIPPTTGPNATWA
jgi:hypothetical protein